MRFIRAVAVYGVTLGTFVACDPLYEIGARVKLGGPPATDTCLLNSMRQWFGFFDGDARRGFQLRLPVPNSYFGSTFFQTHAERDSVLVELTTHWIGDARGEPVEDQRRFVAVAMSTLARLRAMCAPKSLSKIACVAEGYGGRGACEGGT